MIYVGKTVDQEVVYLGSPYSVVLNKTKGVPADDITVNFAIYKKIPELVSISAYLNEELYFYGLIDEQKILYSNQGLFLRLTARNMAAYLLDNEALPTTYCLPSLDLIFKKNIEPYGFKKIIGNRQTFATQFVVSKGMSEWEVLEQFCSKYLKVYPMVKEDGIIDATGTSQNEPIKFSNVEKGIRYISLFENIKRYDMISNVYIRTKKEGSYDMAIQDAEAMGKGIIRKRYLNAVETEKTAAISGELLIDTSKEKSYEVGLVCCEAINVNIGDKAYICDTVLGEIQDMYVSNVRYVLNQSNETTEITLYKR